MQTNYTSPHLNDKAKARFKTRSLDVSESYHLLMEVGTQDPVMQHCLKTLQGMCLSQGVHIGKRKDSSAIYQKASHASSSAGEGGQSFTDQPASGSSGNDVQATRDFQKHIDKYFLPFCSEAIRYFFICGFVPWHVRRLKSTGDLIPEILPLGTFTWHVELRSERQNRKRKERMPYESFHTSYVPSFLSRREGNASGQGKGNIFKMEDQWHAKWKEQNKQPEGDGQQHEFKPEDGIKKEKGHPLGSKRVQEDRETQYLQYRVVMTAGDLTEDEIFIYDFMQPNFNICSNSMMYATIPSPVAHLLIDYKNLRQAQIRRAHAGKFVCTALCNCQPFC
jgi:hypothetical protein